MALIDYSDDALRDSDRFVAHLRGFEVAGPEHRIGEIVAAINILKHSPLIGRLAGHDLRELVIGRGTRGYVALYRYVQETDTVFVLAVRAPIQMTDVPPAASARTSFRSAVTSGRPSFSAKET